MRRFLATIMTAAMFLSMTVTAVAAENEILAIKEGGILVAEKNDIDFVNLEAEILEIGTDEMSNQVTVKDLNNTNRRIVLLVSDSTIIVNQDGIGVNLNELKVGDKIKVVHSKVMTKSVPPQTNTYSIIVNNDETKISPVYAEVSEVSKDENGNVEILTSDRMYRFVLNSQTQVIPYRTKNIVTASDITEGDTILVWFEIVTMSIPAMANPSKVMLISKEILKESSEEIQSVPSVISINGEKLDLGNKKIELINGNVMVPLRDTAEKLGFEVTWNQEEQSVYIDDGAVNTRLYIGNDSYYKASTRALGLTAPFNYGTAPTVIDSSTYVPVQLFNLLYSNDNTVKINGEVIEINVNKAE